MYAPVLHEALRTGGKHWGEKSVASQNWGEFSSPPRIEEGNIGFERFRPLISPSSAAGGNFLLS